MSKIQKLMLQASGVQLTIEKNIEGAIFVTVGQGLIFQAVELSDISLRHVVAQSVLESDSYSMQVGTNNYHLTFENLNKISAFLNCAIENIT
ncbi:hypothetical protein [Vibrio sp. Hal054]|uniref:hypothetical protein n=1 Tax=Vibrio sp. Hal054 TaxID=3035158 RepID=UPI00301C7017